MSNRNRPPARRDAHGECMHLYLTREAQCVHCGMQFKLAWTAERNWLTGPLRKNLTIGIGAIIMVAVGYSTGVSLLSTIALFVAVYFMIRAMFGTVEVFLKHRFSPGKLGMLVHRGRFSITAMKPAYAWIGILKSPMDEQVYNHFNPDDTLLVEYLKWSRLPVAIYRGSLNR